MNKTNHIRCLFIEGPKRSGKTGLIIKALAGSLDSASGYRTVRIKNGNETLGYFHCEPYAPFLSDTDRLDEAVKPFIRLQNDPKFDACAFKSFVLPRLLERSAAFLLMDETGGSELSDEEIFKGYMSALDSRLPVIAVIKEEEHAEHFSFEAYKKFKNMLLSKNDTEIFTYSPLEPEKTRERIERFMRENDISPAARPKENQFTCKPLEMPFALLAGGRSKRMGCDKAFLSFNGEPLFLYTAKKLSSFGTVYISFSHLRGPEDKEKYGYPVIYDSLADCGPAGSIVSVFMKTKEKGIFFFPCDMPLFPKELISDMIEEYHKTGLPVVVKAGGRIYPLPGIYTEKAAFLLKEEILKGNNTLMNVFGRLPHIEVRPEKYGLSKDCLVNINTAKDYEAFLGRMKSNGTKSSS